MESGTKVMVRCPVYFNGKAHFGVITGSRAATNNSLMKTYLVKIGSNKKSTAFSERWITKIN